MYFMFKVRYSNHPTTDYGTVDKMFTIKNNDDDNLNELIKKLSSGLNNLDESYRSSIIIRSIICYKILPLSWVKEDSAKNLAYANELGTSRDVEKIFQSFDLSCNMDYQTWGVVTYDRNNFLIVEDSIKNIVYRITKFYNSKNNLINCEIVVCSQSTGPLLTFTDSSFNKEAGIFKRFIDHYNHEYFYKDNALIAKTIEKKVSVLEPIKKDKLIKNKLITLDIETIVKKGIHIPFCVSFYDGKNKFSFYLSNYKDSEDMLIAVIESLLKPKYSGYNVYVHNLSDFDSIFFFKLLATFKSKHFTTKLTPIFRESNTINLKLNYSKIENKRTLKYHINFRDSLLILPESLDKLANNFNLDTKKTIYPYSFVNDKFNVNAGNINNLILNYIGPVPSIDFFPDNINPAEFIKYLLSFSGKD
jgi:DNA polymerase type B, organellar and viral